MHATIALVEHILLARLQYTRDALLTKAMIESIYRVRLDSIITPKIAIPDYFCSAILDTDNCLLENAHRYVYNANKGHAITLVKRHIKLLGIAPSRMDIKLPNAKTPEYATGVGLWGRYPILQNCGDIGPEPTKLQIAFLYEHRLIS